MSKLTSNQRIHSVFSAVLLLHARNAGVDVAALARRFSLPEATGTPPGLDIPPETVRDLAASAASALGDPFLGLHLASGMPRGVYDVFEFSTRSAPTLAGALGRLARYSVIVSPESVFTLTEGPSGSVISHHITCDPLAIGRHASEFSLAIVMILCRLLIRAEVAPKSASFPHSAPADIGELTRFFGTSAISFDSPESSLSFDRETLAAPLSSADPALLPILDRYAEALLPAPVSGGTLRDQVRRHLRENLVGGPPSMANVAESLRLSPRTLQRRLADLDTSFAAVLDELRRHLARVYLEDPTLPLGEVAYRLGYSDLGAFVRAFKGWNGMTPGRYRARGS